MKIYHTEEFIKMKNPTPSERFKLDILTQEQNAKALGGHFSTLFPGGKLPCHYHETRESLIFLISGEIVETVDDDEHVIKAGDAIYIGAGEKHQMENRSDTEVRYLEFFTPLGRDTIQVPG